MTAVALDDYLADIRQNITAVDDAVGRLHHDYGIIPCASIECLGSRMTIIAAPALKGFVIESSASSPP